MNPLHSWDVSVEEAIRIQEALKRIILKKPFSKIRTIGGGDVAYSKNGIFLFAAIAVLSYPDMGTLDIATTEGKVSFPYIPTLLSFREGPILIAIFQNLKIKPDVMIYDGQGIAHPRGMAASHLGLWSTFHRSVVQTPLFRKTSETSSHRSSNRLIDSIRLILSCRDSNLNLTQAHQISRLLLRET
jgi:deoxyribonuclease V